MTDEAGQGIPNIDRSATASERWHFCRAIRVAEVTVVAGAREAAATRRFDALLSAYQDGDPAAAGLARAAISRHEDGPSVRAAFVSGHGAVTEQIPRQDPPSDQPLSLWEWEDELLANLTTCALDGEPDRLHVHAGLVERDGVGVLLVGPRGAGKSTLTAHLARSGWGYRTDEMVGIGPDAPRVAHPFARPLNLKRGSWPMFAELASVPDPTEALASQERVHVPPAELGMGPHGREVNVGAVIFVSHGPATHEHPRGLTPLGPAEAVERMVAETFDLGRAGSAGLGALVRLAVTTRLYTLHLDGLDHAAPLVAASAVHPGPAKTAVEHLPASAAAPLDWPDDAAPTTARPREIGPATRARRRPCVATWFLPDGALVFDEVSGVLARLDPVAARAWRLLDGVTSLAEIATQLSPDPGSVEVAGESVGALARRLEVNGLIEVASPTFAG